MGATEWSWAFARNRALHGARASRAACGGGISTALIETEAARRLKRPRTTSAPTAAAPAESLNSSVLPLRQLLQRVGREMLGLCADMVGAAQLAALPADATTYVQWCDLRTQPPPQGEVNSSQREPMGKGSYDDTKHDLVALKAKFDLWQQLGRALARYCAAVSCDGDDGVCGEFLEVESLDESAESRESHGLEQRSQRQQHGQQ
jgi:hypothetical protein